MDNRPNTSVTPATWNGRYPLADLPAGDTWTGTYGAASQCVGFAKMVLDATYGAGSTESASATFASGDAAAVEKIFKDKNIQLGDRITFKMRGKTENDSNQHSFIVALWQNNGVTAYDCNRGDDNKIRYEKFTYEAMSRAYDKCRGAVHHA